MLWPLALQSMGEKGFPGSPLRSGHLIKQE